ncbi:MAG: Zn-dependent hydrolase [Actinomycetes bacterium]|jgi:glyoxylase-like metal-dependent hydrolase (beta-lactamase superfamily II)/acetolactate synthase regulatory subunit|nr:Zn-dependent hydrolase [Actinomycetes bacterium]
MKRTFVTTMPDQAGAFLKASRIISRLGLNITRVSYNKAVDSHMLFIDVRGAEAAIEEATALLEAIGYIGGTKADPQLMLLEFRLRDEPGTLAPILELIERRGFNISYINSQEDGSGYQGFKMGLFIEDAGAIADFIAEASQLCPVRALDYVPYEKSLDNTVFYLSFANRIAGLLELDDDARAQLIQQSNRLMQMLEAHGEAPAKPFEYIGRFAELLADSRGDDFRPRITERVLEPTSACDNTGECVPPVTLYCIEPACGSNTFVLECAGKLLFCDGGFACFAPEMRALLSARFSEPALRDAELMLTHPDADHCGLCRDFNRIYATADAIESFRLEAAGKPDFRERKPEHAPYIRISKLLSEYRIPEPRRFVAVDAAGGGADAADAASAGNTAGRDAVRDVLPHELPYVGSIDCAGLRFDWYRGNGGHSMGEAVIVCEPLRLVFSGDICVNARGFTQQQAAFARLAPYLMTSVNRDSAAAAAERAELLRRFAGYLICPGHGPVFEAPEGT